MPPSKHRVQEMIAIIQTHDDKYRPVQVNIPSARLGTKRDREDAITKVQEAILAKHSAKSVVYFGPMDEMPYYKAGFSVQLTDA